MARSKVKLTWIVNDSARKSSFKKRNGCLLKKLREISTLCDVSAFIIVYGSDSDEPTMWPDRSLVEPLIARFQSIPEIERWKKMLNQETYLKERAAKVQEQIRKIMKKNNELNMNDVLHQIIQKGKPLLSFEAKDLTDLVFSLEEKMKEIRKRIDFSKQQHLNYPSSDHPQNERDQSENTSQIRGDLPEYLLWCKDLGKKIENNDISNSSVRSDMGLPLNTYYGSSIATNDMELPSWNFGGNNNDGSYMGSPKRIENFASPSMIVRNEIDVPNGYSKDHNCSRSVLGSPSGVDYKYAKYMEYPYRNWGVDVDGSDKGLPQVNYETNNDEIEMGVKMLPNSGYNVVGNTRTMGNDSRLNLMPSVGDGLLIGESRVEYDDRVLRHLPHQGNIRGSLISHTELPSGGNSGGSDAGLLSRLFGSSNAGSDVGLPYDISKSWQNPFFSP